MGSKNTPGSCSQVHAGRIAWDWVGNPSERFATYGLSGDRETRLYGTFTGPLRFFNKGKASLVPYTSVRRAPHLPSFPLLAAALGATQSGHGRLPPGQS